MFAIDITFLIGFPYSTISWAIFFILRQQFQKEEFFSKLNFILIEAYFINKKQHRIFLSKIVRFKKSYATVIWQTNTWGLCTQKRAFFLAYCCCKYMTHYFIIKISHLRCFIVNNVLNFCRSGKIKNPVLCVSV